MVTQVTQLHNRMNTGFFDCVKLHTLQLELHIAVN